MRALLAILLTLWVTAALAAPLVWQVQDPVQPGETVMLFGDGFGDKPTVTLGRIGDGSVGVPGQVAVNRSSVAAPCSVLEARDQCLKVLIGKDAKPGLYSMGIGNGGQVSSVLINRPQIWWAQADGERLRIFGKNLAGPNVQVHLKGPQTLTVRLGKHEGTWAASPPLPDKLPAGQYQVYYHNGFGGQSGWSEAGQLTISPPVNWPSKVFSVRDFGADGSSQRDDTGAFQAALDAAGAAGGGVVLAPRGRYQITGMLKLPRLVTLRGEGPSLTALYWPDTPTPPEALLQGTNSFAIENLTIYASMARHVIMGDLGDKPDAGNIRLYRVRTRVDAYRGHLSAEETDRRHRELAKIFGGDTVRMGGDNVRIVQCDLYGNGRALFLSRARNSVVRNNDFYNGRHGWYCISGSDGLIFQDNRITGADLMATGGGLNCLDGSSYSQNVYYARNTLALMHGWDREAMTSDAGGGLYYGPIAKAEGTTLTLPETPKSGKNWTGAAAFVFSGKGWTQVRRVAKVEGDTITLDRPWDVPPDATSLVGITMLQRHYILEDNSFSDAGIAIQFYGTSLEHIVSGNTCARAGGFQGIGKPYGGYQLPPDKNPCHQPSWFCQYVGNEISEGSIYRSGANNAILSGDSVIGIYGWPLTRDWPWPYNVGSVVRHNRLANNARLHAGGNGNERPSVSDAVIEANDVACADEALRLDRATRGLLVRENRFTDVRNPLSGEGLPRATYGAGQLGSAELTRLEAAARQCGLTKSVASWPELQQPLGLLNRATAWDTAAQQASAQAAAALLAGLQQRQLAVAPQVACDLLGLQVKVGAGSTLPAVLAEGGGGVATVHLEVSLTRSLPGWRVGAEAALPGAQAVAAAPVELADNKATLPLQVQVPPALWGRVMLPVKITIALPQGPVQLTRPLPVGSGPIRSWSVVGPFPNKSGQPLDLTLYPPEDALNLHGDVAGPMGPLKWQDVRNRGDWLDLGALLKTKEPGVAYAVACLRSEKETPAVLLLGSSGGLSVTLNGQYVWSLSQSRNAAAGQDRVPLMLRPGDNVLLIKSCTLTDQWKLTAELIPVGEAFAGAVAVVPATEFRRLPVFAPPQPRSTPQTGEIKFPAGVNWRLVHADDFTSDTLGGRWRAAIGTWTPKGGMVQSTGDHAFLAYAEKLPAPVRIEYDTRVIGGTGGDLSAFWLTNPADYSTGYLVGFGSNGNVCNKLLVDGAEVITATRPLVVPGKWHHVIMQVLPEGRVQLIVDDQLSLDYKGKVLGQARHPGLWTWGPEGAFSKVRVYRGE